MPDPAGTAVLAVAAALVLTKLLDVLSTLRHIKVPGEESNPLAARLMHSVGVRTASWLVFSLASTIVVSTAWLALEGPLAESIAFCVTGLVVALIQACVARANFRGRQDAVTRLILRVHWHIGTLRRRGGGD